MYGHDGAGPAPSLYIGTTVPMITTWDVIITADYNYQVAGNDDRLKICATLNTTGIINCAVNYDFHIKLSIFDVNAGNIQYFRTSNVKLCSHIILQHTYIMYTHTYHFIEWTSY